MASTKQPMESNYRCPECSGHLARHHRTWRCTDCGYCPPHGAD